MQIKRVSECEVAPSHENEYLAPFAKALRTGGQRSAKGRKANSGFFGMAEAMP
jgi:hypothetical protein